jgi:hypothetical protein
MEEDRPGGEQHGFVTLTPEQQRRRRIRSLAIGFGLAALVVIFFLVTIIRLGGNVANRPL